MTATASTDEILFGQASLSALCTLSVIGNVSTVHYASGNLISGATLDVSGYIGGFVFGQASLSSSASVVLDSFKPYSVIPSSVIEANLDIITLDANFVIETLDADLEILTLNGDLT